MCVGVNALKEVPGFKVFKTEGSFCVYINVKAYPMSSEKLSEALLSHAGVLTVPGTAFGANGEGYIRMCFANSDKNITEGTARIKNFLNTFISKCDVAVSTLPSTPETFHLLDAHAFSIMKKGSSIINVSRGSIIDETALIEKIKEGHFRGVALDVFEKEPLDTDSPLWTFDNVIITPHNALYSDLYDTRVFEMIYDNLKRYLQKEELVNPVDFDKGY